MSLTELMSALRERGITLRAEGERLRCIAEQGALTPELSAGIRSYKAELIELLRAVPMARAASLQVARVERRDRYGLSVTQERAVVAAREGAMLPTAFLLRGPLDRSVLERTLAQIVARHAPLRSIFHLDQDPPEQQVLASVDFVLGEDDFSALPEEPKQERMREVLEHARVQRFDVSKPPLFRFHLIRCSPLEHVLFTAFSPLVFDGWSFDVFWNDLRTGYAALVAGGSWPDAGLPAEYADYVAYQSARLRERAPVLEQFWRERLGSELPALPLPTDRPRSRRGGKDAGRLAFELPPQTARAIRTFARERNVTPQMVMLGGLYALVHRIGGEERIVVATPVEARGNPAFEQLIGPFVNMLLLPMRVDIHTPFAAFVVRVRDECLGAYDHQDFPIERLRVRSAPSADGGIAPAFQVEFSYQQVSQRGSHMGPLSLSQLELPSGAATNDLTLWVKDWGERIAGAVEFKSDLFDGETVAHWFRCYTHFLHELVRAPDTSMVALDLLGAERSVVEAAAARASADLPEWLTVDGGAALQASGRKATVRIRDAFGNTCPLGAFGTVELAVDGVAKQTSYRARLSHAGRLLRAQPAEHAARRAAEPDREPPRTDLERQMTSLFGELLDASDVGVNQNYFELGGNSLVAVRLFGEIHKRFGVRLPLATILDADTPRRLARLVTDNFPNRDSCLVRLKAGTGELRLFLVHDADGETLLYLNLARHLPDSISVFGIEPLRVGPLAMAHTTLPECAAHYLREMRRQQPRGPYFVGGLCAGGLISYEIARQLVASGEQVGLLAFLDAAPPTAKKRSTVSAGRLRRFADSVQQLKSRGPLSTLRLLGSKIVNAARYEREARVARARAAGAVWLQRHVFKNGQAWPKALPTAAAREVFARAEAEFQPGVLRDVNAVLFRASVGYAADRAAYGAEDDRPFRELLVAPDFGWQPLLERTLRVIDVPGGHSSMLRQPHAQVLAARILELIEAGHAH